MRIALIAHGNGVALALRVGLRALHDWDAHARRPARPTPAREPPESNAHRCCPALLVADARERILLVSFGPTLGELAGDLEADVQRGCQVDVVLNRPRAAGPDRRQRLAAPSSNALED